MSLFLSIRLLSDVASTESSATIGGHSSLSFIPGASLLGACARLLYDRLPEETSWRLFHSGEVRFGNGYPVGTGGDPALPVPLSLHAPKREKQWEDGRLAPHVINLSYARPETGTQYEQLRGASIDGTLARVRSEKRASLRTAIGADGRARDGFLFSVAALPAGRELAARVDGPDDLLALVREAFDGRRVGLGRSKNAEFGQALLRLRDPWRPPATGEHRDDAALFWLVSDLCLRDEESGQPTFEPRSSNFGLPEGWKLDPSRTFLRTRRYSPFNAKRKRPDLERQVIAAGSVLVFRAEGAPALDPASVESALAPGIGEYRQDGLGQALWDPAALSGARPSAWTSPAPETPAAVVPRPDDELARWLGARHRISCERDLAWSLAMKWLEDLHGKAEAPLPSASQWGEVRRIARSHRLGQPEGLAKALEGFTSHGVRKLKKSWGAPLGETTLREVLILLVREAGTGNEGWAVAATATEILATHIARRRPR